MRFEVRLHRLAKQDLRRAAAWYEDKSVGLGRDFLACVQRSLQVLGERGDVLPLAYRHFRRIWIDRFPYGVFFRVAGDELVVIAVLHNRQSLSRLDDRDA